MKGLDLLGLGSPAWDVTATYKNWPDGYALGVFDGGWPNAFGSPINAVQKILDTGKCPAVRVHIWWDPSHKLVPLPNLKKRLPLWQALAVKYPNVKFYVSPSCEYSEKDVSKIKACVDAIKQLAPKCAPVLAPMNSPVVPGVITESHGSHASGGKGSIVSTDGQNLPDMDAASWVSKNSACEIIFGWAMRFNLAESHVSLPPNKRTAAPNVRYIREVARVLEPKGSAPAPGFAGKFVPIQKPFLYKVMAEDMPGPQQRDNLPLLIVKGKPLTATIVARTGAAIGTLKVFDKPGMYPGGLTRYYAGVPGAINLYGWEIGWKALQVSGSEFVWFHVDDRFYGPVNAGFREGFYQS